MPLRALQLELNRPMIALWQVQFPVAKAMLLFMDMVLSRGFFQMTRTAFAINALLFNSTRA